MNPIAMLTILVAAHAAFFWSASRRWQLLHIGRADNRLDRIGDRLKAVWRYAFVQQKMDYYQPAGIAHKLIFVGFGVLLARTIILAGRGFVPDFSLFVLGLDQPLGKLYDFAKDSVAVLVLCGVSVFFYYRKIKPSKRTTLHWEGTLILCIIGTMMIADMLYDGAGLALASRHLELCEVMPKGTNVDLCASVDKIVGPYMSEAHGAPFEWSLFPSPMGSLIALELLKFKIEPGTLVFLAHAGFWTHISLVLIFLNLLPHSKHFHVITAIPNVFLRDLNPPGRLAPMADTHADPEAAAKGEPSNYGERLMSIMEKASEAADPGALPIGIGRIEHVTWKAVLDFYTCTECGRCSDNCPAHRTGKLLSPKHLTLDLRDHLYAREEEFIKSRDGKKEAEAKAPSGAPAEAKPAGEAASEGAAANGATDASAAAAGTDVAASAPLFKPIDLVSNVIHPDVLWACTTCRACEEQCPVMISYVDKIVDMRRNLVMVRNEFPHELQKPFQGMEVNGNPWNLSRMDRAQWSDGLGIPTMGEKPTAQILYWVGCAASYDDRAKKIARATAKLMKMAGVDFAILGQEENCTGDPARRAGNEFLFAMLADGNVTTLNGYKEQGGIKTIVTTCPHCFNTLKNEYPDFGAKFDVVHHTDYLLGLLAEKKLKAEKPVEGRVVYHDSCYLGRYNGVYESPREILKRIPGVELVEAEYWTRQRGLCCGAGGAQMFMEEQNTNRVNIKRTLQLIDALEKDAPPPHVDAAGNHVHGAKTIASGCPFCMTMLTDGLKSQSVEDKVKQLDVAEILVESCVAVEAPAEVPAELLVPPTEAAAAEPTATA